MLHLLSETSTTVGWSDVSEIITALTAQINVKTIVGVVAAALAASVGIAFMWWVGRKGVRAIMSAFKKGKVSV